MSCPDCEGVAGHDCERYGEPPVDVVGEIRERDALGEWALHMYDERDDQETDQ